MVRIRVLPPLPRPMARWYAFRVYILASYISIDIIDFQKARPANLVLSPSDASLRVTAVGHDSVMDTEDRIAMSDVSVRMIVACCEALADFVTE